MEEHGAKTWSQNREGETCGGGEMIWLLIAYFGFNSYMTTRLIKDRADWLLCVLAFFFGAMVIVMYFFVVILGKVEGR